MKRLIVVATVLASIGGVAGAASASVSTKNDNHNVCVVLASDHSYQNTQYYCISTPELPAVLPR